ARAHAGLRAPEGAARRACVPARRGALPGGPARPGLLRAGGPSAREIPHRIPTQTTHARTRRAPRTRALGALGGSAWSTWRALGRALGRTGARALAPASLQACARRRALPGGPACLRAQEGAARRACAPQLALPSARRMGLAWPETRRPPR